MRSTAKKIVEECECNISKAHLHTSHKMFRPTEYEQPRTAYGVDFYEIGGSRHGYVGLLTIIDLFTRRAILKQSKTTLAKPPRPSC